MNSSSWCIVVFSALWLQVSGMFSFSSYVLFGYCSLFFLFCCCLYCIFCILIVSLAMELFEGEEAYSNPILNCILYCIVLNKLLLLQNLKLLICHPKTWNQRIRQHNFNCIWKTPTFFCLVLPTDTNRSSPNTALKSAHCFLWFFCLSSA